MRIRIPRLHRFGWRTPAALAAAAAVIAGAAATATIATGIGPIQAAGYHKPSSFPVPPHAHLVTNTDDYGAKSATYNTANPDTGFFYKNCTDFVAYRLRDEGYSQKQGATTDFKNAVGSNPTYWGNAYNWAAAARSLGLPVDRTPTVGAVAVFPSNWHSANGYDYVGAAGHVAVVSKIVNGTVWVEDYNYYAPRGAGMYHNHPMATDRGVSFIHFPLGGTGGPPPAHGTALKVANGHLSGHPVTVEMNLGAKLEVRPGSTPIGSWETFQVRGTPNRSGAVALWSPAARGYVSAEFAWPGNTRGTLHARPGNTSIGTWEMFHEVGVCGHTALTVNDSSGNTWYVSVEQGGNGEAVLRARTSVADFNNFTRWPCNAKWELFDMPSF